MIKRSAFAAALLVSTACSGQPQATASSQPDAAAPRAQAQTAPVTELPKNAPASTIRNVAATTGRGNLPQTRPAFRVETIGGFDAPFAMAFLPDGRLLVTEKAGRLKLRGTDGQVTDVSGVPAVAADGQGGLLDVAVAPDVARSGTVYLTYAESVEVGSQLALARATLVTAQGGAASLEKLRVIWRSGSVGVGGQFGATIAFSPDGKYLFLSSGERQRFTPAQDPDQALGKVLRLTPDGKAAPGNPMYAAGGVRAMTWTSGHRNPYGLAFAPDGRLWEEEMGPKGGDELNLLEPGRNYGWPLVSNGDNYSGQVIPDHPSRPDLAAPKLWWNPSISPSGMAYYSGALFPQFRGSLFIGAMSTPGLVRVALDGATATAADFWDMGARIRDVAQAPDGSIWLLEDGGRGSQGKLLRLTPGS
jgi:glucose/arabinose dehydrogenase